MNDELLAERIAHVISIFEEAVDIERRLPDKHRVQMDAKSSWIQYQYEEDDLKDQAPEFKRSIPSAKQVDLLNRALTWLDILGTSRTNRTIMRKRIVWSRGNKLSYREIAFFAGISPTSVERIYKIDMEIITRKVFLE